MEACLREGLGLVFTAPWAKPSTDAPPWAKPSTDAPPWADAAKEPVWQGLPEPVRVKQEQAQVEQARVKQEQARVRQADRMLKVDERPLQRRRVFPRAEEDEEPSPVQAAPAPRLCSSRYSAVEIHGFFGLIDDGPDGAGRALVVHVPRWVRGYWLDIRQGDTLHVNRADGRAGGVLTVLATGRHKYYSPGRRVTTCTVLVPEEQWAPFA